MIHQSSLHHDTRVSIQPEQEPAKCSNYSADLRANFKNCPKVLEYQRALERHRTPPTPSGSFCTAHSSIRHRTRADQQQRPHPPPPEISQDGLADIILFSPPAAGPCKFGKSEIFRLQSSTVGKIMIHSNGVMDPFNLIDGSP